jgi:hypothetical protein
MNGLHYRPPLAYSTEQMKRSRDFTMIIFLLVIATLPMFLRRVSVSEAMALLSFRNSGQPYLSRNFHFDRTGFEALKVDNWPVSIMIHTASSLANSS